MYVFIGFLSLFLKEYLNGHNSFPKNVCIPQFIIIHKLQTKSAMCISTIITTSMRQINIQ